jgi:Fur family transcriptional regulator, ferric uptake regulator
MNELQIEKTLRDSGLKKTTVRIAVLRHLSDSSNALSQPEFEAFFKGQENRVTVYRVLRDLEEKGLIHRVYDVEGIARFALCRSCNEHTHNDEHIHFNCVACKNVFCLEDINLTIPVLPSGFKINMIHFTVEGICEKCNNN